MNNTIKNLREAKNCVFIEKISRLEWGKNSDISFIRSAQLALNSMGENYSYQKLMGISGAAFRLHFHSEWCPSAGDATTGFDVSKVLFKSLGYNCELYSIDDNSFNDIKSLYKRIIEHINNGIPIIAFNLKVCPEWGLITGYLKNRPGILCRTYFDESEEYSLAEHAPWLSYFIGEKVEPLNDDELFYNSLNIAVKLAKTEEFEKYKSGFSAFEYWIEELKKYTTLEKRKPFKEHEVNLTLFYYLIDSRQAAIKYVDDNKNRLKKGDHIISNYKKEIKLLREAQKNLLPTFESKSESWTKDIIEAQIDILKQALSLEKEAISLIELELKH